MNYNFQQIDSPIGALFLVAKQEKLSAVVFEAQWIEWRQRYTELLESETPLLVLAKLQVQEYFSQRRTQFELPYQFEGTPFQISVWEALARIPYGETRTYKQQAIMVDNPKAIRAIGRTNGLNPMPIVFPCHRVVGSDGSLTGYAGGLEMKLALLKLENASNW